MLNSSDDFESPRPSRGSKLGRKKTAETATATQVPKGREAPPAIETCLPPCPLCGKTFASGDSSTSADAAVVALAARGNHLRTCGKARGLSTERLLEIRQLEERQAREREELGLLPKHEGTAPKARGGRLNGDRKEGRTRRQKQQGDSKSQVDPHLELALALSASIAQGKACSTSKSNIEADPSTSAETAPTCIKRDEARGEGSVGACKFQRQPSKACSALQSRDEEARQRIIQARVEDILLRHSAPTRKPNHGIGRDAGAFTSSGGSANWWKSASSKSAPSSNGILGAYANAAGTVRSREDLKTVEVSASLGPGVDDGVGCKEELLQGLSQSWLDMLDSGRDADVLVYTRDQRCIPCHELVLRARCPKLIEDVTVESAAGGEEQRIIPLSDVSHVSARVLLAFVYGGRLPASDDVQKRTDFDALLRLSKRLGLFQFAQALGSSVDQTLLVPEDEEDEWDQLAEGEDKSSQHPQSENGASGGSLVSSNATPEGEEESEVGGVCDASVAIVSPGQSISQEFAAQTSVLVPDSDEDLFGDEEVPTHSISRMTDVLPGDGTSHESTIGSQRSHSQHRERFSERKSDEDVNDVWEDFDCDVGGGDDVLASHVSENVAGLGDCSMDDADDNTDTEHVPSSTPVKSSKLTPIHQGNGARSSSLPGDADYEKMLTPELRRELRRFGLKVIPRRKAVPLLRHIRDETRRREKRGRSATPPLEEREEVGGDASQSSLDDSFQLAEESVYGAAIEDDADAGAAEDGDGESPSGPASQAGSGRASKGRTVSGEEVSALLRTFLLGDAALAAKVLTYEPLWLEDAFAAFKAAFSVRCKLALFMDALDAECVTFRTRTSANRRRRRGAGGGRGQRQASASGTEVQGKASMPQKRRKVNAGKVLRTNEG